MSDNVIIQPLFHQRSHSMPISHAFINGNRLNTMSHENLENTTDSYDYKRSSTLKLESSPNQIAANDGFPLPIPKSIASHFRSSLSETVKREDDEPSFFCTPKTFLNVFDVNNKDVSCPVILNCKMDRGFFISQSHWTCYRRNYFQTTASFIIPGHSDQACYAVQLNSDKPMQPIQQFLVRLRACTSTSSFLVNGDLSNENDNTNATLKNHNLIRPVALTQMTPKRDKGPQREPPSIPIHPSDNIFSSEHSCVTFERLQFKVATANNGKRRASQQFFRLIFELIVQLDDGSQHVVSECYSSPLVVRGRSPGHYNTDTQFEARKRRRPSPIKRPLPLSPHSSTLNSPSIETQNQDHQTAVTLPPPQFVYAPPSMMIDTRPTAKSITTTTSNDSPVSYTSPHQQQQQHHHPLMSPISFGTIHGRSQSANDSEFFARHRKYPAKMEYHSMQQNSELFDNYGMGMERALRNWQQHVVRQRTDSNTTFNSYDNNDRTSTRSDTPYNYNNMYHSAAENGSYWRSH